jgi:formate hydrogenlyase subunit 3/multisubunit Na+/H+ antiporter MnhD subunit
MSTRKRFVAALIAALLSGVACIATLIEPQWFERLFDEAPDGGDGSLETLVAVVVSLGACLFFGLLAWRARRREQREAATRAVIVKDLA